MRAPLVLRPGQRLLIIIGGLLLLPAILLLGSALTLGLLRAQSNVETRALQQADTLIAAADARVAIDRSALRTFATADSLRQGDWRAAEDRARAVVAANPGWRGLLAIDDSRRTVLFDTRDDGALVPASAALKVRRLGPGRPSVVLAEPVPGRPGFRLVALVDPGGFQDVLMKDIPDTAVAAVVDGDGVFVARSLDFENRVGTPATAYVRQAVARGGRDIYEGRTFEGLENYSAYATSPTTGWSAHFAVNRKLIDSPRFWLFIVLVGGALTTLLAAGGVITYGLIDMAARRRAEEQLLRLQKSEAIGQFTSGVAHDFNNLLTVVIANLERIRKSDAGPDVTRRAELALEAAHRGARLSNQLLSFAREDGAKVESVDIPALLDQIRGLLAQSVGAGIALEIHCDEIVGAAMANRDQLELALLNLAINARDAMGGVGRLEIRALRRDERVEIAVQDSGPGVPPHARPRLFEPFFTTKAAGKGTGLGLAQVAGAAAQAGGSVRLDETAESGARFLIDLPAATVRAPRP